MLTTAIASLKDVSDFSTLAFIFSIQTDFTVQKLSYRKVSLYAILKSQRRKSKALFRDVMAVVSIHSPHECLYKLGCADLYYGYEKKLVNIIMSQLFEHLWWLNARCKNSEKKHPCVLLGSLIF